MISNEADLQSNLSSLQETLTLSPKDLSERMNASEINSINQDIFNALNTLYERIRTLEDIKDYMRTTILSTIQERKKKINEILISIEKNNDIYTSDKKQAVSVPYTWSNETAKDRDGSSLAPLVHDTDSRLYPQGNVAYLADISCINHECSDTPFTITKSESDGYYHVRYLKTKPDFINDTITILFKEPKEINYIECSVFNADYSVNYLTKNNESVSVQDNQYIEPVTMYGLTIELIGDHYNTVTQNIDKEKQAQDSFSKFSSQTSESLQTESESASSLQNKQFQKDASDYIRKVGEA